MSKHNHDYEAVKLTVVIGLIIVLTVLGISI